MIDNGRHDLALPIFPSHLFVFPLNLRGKLPILFTFLLVLPSAGNTLPSWLTPTRSSHLHPVLAFSLLYQDRVSCCLYQKSLYFFSCNTQFILWCFLKKYLECDLCLSLFSFLTFAFPPDDNVCDSRKTSYRLSRTQWKWKHRATYSKITKNFQTVKIDH